jgi:glycosyltransferase involved in cell wall biosynthesis
VRLAFRPCAIVPTFDNPGTIEAVTDAIRALGLPVIVVDDASGPEARQVLDGLRDRALVLRRETNGGKGAAVKTGLKAAHERRFTHALQVDADGQHDLEAAATMLDRARQDPESLVLGAPVFDESAPEHRRAMRKVSIFWVAAATALEGSPVRDPMCGFRVYPVGATVDLLDRCGDRMDFDPEVAVRLVWSGCAVHNVPVRVRYFSEEEGGVSHFRALHDNALISLLFGRLMMLRYLGVWRWL